MKFAKQRVTYTNQIIRANNVCQAQPLNNIYIYIRSRGWVEQMNILAKAHNIMQN